MNTHNVSHSNAVQRATHALTISLQPQRIARWLTLLVLAIVVVGTLARIVIYQVAPDPEHKLARLMQRFDLGHEPSVANWYSSLALLASAGLLLGIATTQHRQRATDTRYWYGLATVFLCLAFDEAIMIHELPNNFLQDRFGFRGVLYYAWIIPGAFFTLLVGVTFLGFLQRLDARTRWLFVTAGTMFVTGAIGFEMVEGALTHTYGIESVVFTLAQTVEESLEMLGIVVFIFALLDYLQRHVGRMTVHFAPKEEIPDGFQTAA